MRLDLLWVASVVAAIQQPAPVLIFTPTAPMSPTDASQCVDYSAAFDRALREAADARHECESKSVKTGLEPLGDIGLACFDFQVRGGESLIDALNDRLCKTVQPCTRVASKWFELANAQQTGVRACYDDVKANQGAADALNDALKKPDSGTQPLLDALNEKLRDLGQHDPRLGSDSLAGKTFEKAMTGIGDIQHNVLDQLDAALKSMREPAASPKPVSLPPHANPSQDASVANPKAHTAGLEHPSHPDVVPGSFASLLAGPDELPSPVTVECETSGHRDSFVLSPKGGASWTADAMRGVCLGHATWFVGPENDIDVDCEDFKVRGYGDGLQLQGFAIPKTGTNGRVSCR